MENESRLRVGCHAIDTPVSHRRKIRMMDGLCIRTVNENDPRSIEEAFRRMGWVKPVALFERYRAEQAAGTRVCLVAHFNDVFAGYVTVNWRPDYPGFAESRIPEIQDLNVLSKFRGRGIGTALLD